MILRELHQHKFHAFLQEPPPFVRYKAALRAKKSSFPSEHQTAL